MPDQASDTDALIKDGKQAPTRRTNGKRARTLEQKEAVRDALIAAGRRAFAEQDYSKVSLRGIAAEAGYAPGLIYRYFEDRQALLMAVREVDLAQAIEKVDVAVRGESDPAKRLRKLFLATLKHWRAHLDEYEVLFAGTRRRPMVRSSAGTPFSHSKVAILAYKQCEDAVREFFDSLPRYPMSLKLATDSIVVSIHGAVALPVHLEAVKWSGGEKLAGAIADSLIDGWRAAAEKA